MKHNAFRGAANRFLQYEQDDVETMELSTPLVDDAYEIHVSAVMKEGKLATYGPPTPPTPDPYIRTVWSEAGLVLRFDSRDIASDHSLKTHKGPPQTFQIHARFKPGKSAQWVAEEEAFNG